MKKESIIKHLKLLVILIVVASPVWVFGIFYDERREHSIDYLWSGGLPKDSMVTNLCHKEILIFGYDMMSKPWLSKELDSENKSAYYRTALNKSLEDNYLFLTRNNFDYVTIGASCVAKFKMDINLVNIRIQQMLDSPRFDLIYNTPTEFLFRVVNDSRWGKEIWM